MTDESEPITVTEQADGDDTTGDPAKAEPYADDALQEQDPPEESCTQPPADERGFGTDEPADVAALAKEGR